MRLVVIAQLRDKAYVGISLEHVGKMFNLQPRGFFEDTAFARGGSVALLVALATHAAQIAA